VNSQFAVDSYAKVHRQANVEVANPHKLIDMLYEGALERISQARGAIQYGNIELRGKKINSAIEIVNGLRTCLDREQGGEIAENLDGLYVYIQSILAAAHRKSDVALLEEASKLLSHMRATWLKIGSV